ncbi:MAG: hypothetical protein IJM23_01910 [Lachnospiraceae bacterium]|nr:hypothetical protein [Lachnospiraceae bacterium]
MDNRGSAMITAIVVGVIMAVFCLSLLLVTYTLYAQTAKRNALIQCKYAAGSMAQLLEEELKDPTSDLNNKLEAEMRHQKDDGSFTGTWAPAGNSSSEADDVLAYRMDYSGDESAFKAYAFDVSFKYTKVGDTESDAGGETIDYDGQFNDKTQADETEWDEMVGADGAGAGGYNVTMEVTCSRGDTVYVVKKDVQGVTFADE